MVVAVLKLYFFGMAISVLAVLFEIVDSFGGLMYVQDHQYIIELEHRTKKQKQVSSSSCSRASCVTKRIGS